MCTLTKYAATCLFPFSKMFTILLEHYLILFPLLVYYFSCFSPILFPQCSRLPLTFKEFEYYMSSNNILIHDKVSFYQENSFGKDDKTSNGTFEDLFLDMKIFSYILKFQVLVYSKAVQL